MVKDFGGLPTPTLDSSGTPAPGASQSDLRRRSDNCLVDRTGNGAASGRS